MSVHYYELPLSMHAYRSIVSIRMIETYISPMQVAIGLCIQVYAGQLPVFIAFLR